VSLDQSTAGDAPRLLLTTNNPGTLAAFLLPFAEHFRSRGWRVDAACNEVPDDPSELQAFDRIHPMPWTRRPFESVNLMEAPRRLRELVARERYDIVHSHDPVPGFVTRFALRRARRRLGVAVINTAHGFHFHRGAPLRDHLTLRVAESMASLWTDFLVVINQEDRALARTMPISRDRIVYMPGIGVDMSRYAASNVPDGAAEAVRRELQLSDGQQLLLMVAEFLPRKRHLDALEALERSGRDDVVLAFAGQGVLEEQVRAEVARRGLDERVRFLGFRKDVPSLLAASFALILPSEREGLPRCIMEASCLERPTIAYDIRGVHDLVDEDTGALSPLGDVDGLASAVRRLASEPGSVEAMGARARLAMDTFDLQNVLALHDELYQRALMLRRRPAARAG
jgi:glycosyltransferase involved in cell wall biosynthesis